MNKEQTQEYMSSIADAFANRFGQTYPFTEVYPHMWDELADEACKHLLQAADNQRELAAIIAETMLKNAIAEMQQRLPYKDGYKHELIAYVKNLLDEIPKALRG